MNRSAIVAWRSEVVTSGVGSNARLVALVLSLHMNRDGGSCFPSLARLARESGLSRRTVCNALNELEAAQLVDRLRQGRGRPTHYHATSARGALAGPGGSACGAPQLVHLVHPTSARGAPKDVQEDAQEGVHHPYTHKPKGRAVARRGKGEGARAAGAHPDSDYLDAGNPT